MTPSHQCPLQLMKYKLAVVPESGHSMKDATHVFRLYIAGEAVNSVLAQHNLKAFCQQFYPDNYQIQLVDVLLSPERAWNEGITVTPMLLRLLPIPSCKIMGNLSDTQELINILGSIND